MSKTRQLQQIFKTYSEMFQISVHSYNTRSAAAGTEFLHNELETGTTKVVFLQILSKIMEQHSEQSKRTK